MKVAGPNMPAPHGRVAAVRTRYEGSWADDLVKRLKAVDAFSATTLFGSALLVSVLPLIIVLSSLANERIDDDLSRHIGLDAQGAGVVRTLFRATPAHSIDPIVIAVVLGVAGTVATVAYLCEIYERVFELPKRGWRDTPRYVAWVLALLAALVVEGLLREPLRSAFGSLVQDLVGLAALGLFIWWTMHFLLAGRVPWRTLVRPAIVTTLLWLVLAIASALTFSDTIVSDSKLYGTIGVVFTLLTWFVLIGLVLVMGAAGGLVWEQRRSRRAR